jgi:uncharacterized membrane protein
MSDWFYAANNEQKGPINESELKASFASGKLPTDTLVWKDGMDNWTAANSIPAFSFRQPPAPAKVQPGSVDAGATTASNAPASDKPSSTVPVDITTILGKGQSLEVDPEDVEKNKIFGILSYLGPLCFLPLIAAKDSPYAMYHANQGFVLFLATFAAFLVTVAGILIPFVGLLFYFVHIILYLVYGVAVIYGIINAAAGKCVPIPYIGGIKLLK